jgi:outer membrane protein assembly factor BamB
MSCSHRALLVALLAAGCGGDEGVEPDAMPAADAGPDAAPADAGIPDAVPPDANPWPAVPAPGQFAWALQLVGMNDQTAIAGAPDGAIVVAGEHRAGFAVGDVRLPAPTGAALAVLKLGPEGAPLWARSFDGGTRAILHTVATTPDGDILIGGSYAGPIDLGQGAMPVVDQQEGFLARLDGSTGATEWAKALAGDDLYSDAVVAVVAEPGGDLYVYGEIGDDAVIDGAPVEEGAYLTRMGGDGSRRWWRSFPSVDPGWKDTLILDAEHRPVIAGNFYASLTLDDTVLTVDREEYYRRDLFLAGFEGDGRVRLVRHLRDESDGQVRALAVAGNGDLYLGGDTDRGQIVVDEMHTIWSDSSGNEGFLLRLDAEGQYVWSTTFETPYFYGGFRALAIDGDGSVFLAASCDGQTRIAPEFACARRNSSVLASFGADNRWRWASYVDASYAWAQALVVVNQRLLVVGETSGDTDFGGVQVPGGGFFVAEVAP